MKIHRVVSEIWPWEFSLLHLKREVCLRIPEYAGVVWSDVVLLRRKPENPWSSKQVSRVVHEGSDRVRVDGPFYARVDAGGGRVTVPRSRNFSALTVHHDEDHPKNVSNLHALEVMGWGRKRCKGIVQNFFAILFYTCKLKLAICRAPSVLVKYTLGHKQTLVGILSVLPDDARWATVGRAFMLQARAWLLKVVA